jgi:prepilin-type N-terminal cleavage/methylation domain-containing protein
LFFNKFFIIYQLEKGSIMGCGNYRKGFTLIELIIVIAIIIILTGVAVPLGAGYITERNVYNAATQIQQDLLLAQNLAITHSSDASGWFEIYFYPSGNKYYVETTEDAVFTPPSNMTGKVITRKFSTALKFSGYSDGGYVAFDNQGIPHPSGGVITLSNTSESKVVTVTISPIGRVKIDWVLK